MKSKNNSKRKVIQWIAFGIVILTLVLKLVLLNRGIASTSSTIDAITWVGFTIGIILLLISYLLPKNIQNNSTHSN